MFLWPPTSRAADLTLPMSTISFITICRRQRKTIFTARGARHAGTRAAVTFILGPEEHLPEYVDAAVEEYVPDNAVGSIPQPEMTTLYIGKGKKDKISKGDVLGFLCKTGGLSATEVGRIDIGDRFCYVAVRREKAGEVLAMTAGKKIKGIKTVFEKLR